MYTPTKTHVTPSRGYRNLSILSVTIHPTPRKFASLDVPVVLLHSQGEVRVHLIDMAAVSEAAIVVGDVMIETEKGIETETADRRGKICSHVDRARHLKAQ